MNYRVVISGNGEFDGFFAFNFESIEEASEFANTMREHTERDEVDIRIEF